MSSKPSAKLRRLLLLLVACVSSQATFIGSSALMFCVWTASKTSANGCKVLHSETPLPHRNEQEKNCVKLVSLLYIAVSLTSTDGSYVNSCLPFLLPAAMWMLEWY